MKVTRTNISMTRGDSETITVNLQDRDGNLVPFQDGDILYFTVKETMNTVDIMLQKIITTFIDDSALIVISPDDTKEWRFKDYIYDVQLTQANGTVTTVIKPSKFTIEGEVTHD